MALPDAVQKQVDAGNAAHEEAYKSGEPAPGGQPPAEATPAMEIVDAPPLVTPPAGETPAGEEPPAVVPEQSPAAPPGDDVPEEKWKARYQALQGKYNKELPLLNDANKALTARVEGLENLISQMGAAQTAAPAGDGTLEVSQDLIDEFGEDFMSAVGKLVTSQTSSLRTENEELKGRLDQMDKTDTDVAQGGLMTALAAAIPDWNDQNEDPDFLVWLGQTDVISGKSRQSLLDTALAELNSASVIGIFQAYKTENAGLTPPSNDIAPQPPVSKETLVVPGTTLNGAPLAPDGNEKRQWSQAQIANFYNDVTAGKWKGRDAEKLATEQDIIAASGDGRIIG